MVVCFGLFVVFLLLLVVCFCLQNNRFVVCVCSVVVSVEAQIHLSEEVCFCFSTQKEKKSLWILS